MALEELVPENHIVRVIDAVIDRLNISDILSAQCSGANIALNPKMILESIGVLLRE